MQMSVHGKGGEDCTVWIWNCGFGSEVTFVGMGGGGRQLPDRSGGYFRPRKAAEKGEAVWKWMEKRR